MYDSTLDQRLKEFVSDRTDGKTGLVRRDYVEFGRMYERQVIAETARRTGKKSFSLEELIQVVEGKFIFTE